MSGRPFMTALLGERLPVGTDAAATRFLRTVAPLFAENDLCALTGLLRAKWPCERLVGFLSSTSPEILNLAAGCLGVGLFTIRGLPVPTFASFLTAVLFANLYVQGWVMPRRDPSAADKRFLIAVDRELPPDARVIAVGEPESARHIFTIQRHIDGVWNVGDIGDLLDGEDVFFAITRQRNRAALQQFGRTTKMKQSLHTRREVSAADRFTLYRVDVRPRRVAARSTQHRQK